MTVELLSPDDVAAIVGLTAYTVRAAVRAGELDASKIRGRIRIHPDAVAAWIDDTRVRPGGSVGDRGTTRTPTPRLSSAGAYDDRERAREMRRQRRDAA